MIYYSGAEWPSEILLINSLSSFKSRRLGVGFKLYYFITQQHHGRLQYDKRLVFERRCWRYRTWTVRQQKGVWCSSYGLVA